MIEFGMVFLTLAILAGFFMAWGVGANDVANAMGTSVGSNALTTKQAILIAIVFEFFGAWLAGSEVTSTIRKGIVDTSLLQDDPRLLIYGMLSSLLAAAIWLAVASSKGWPVSTTHSIVGAIVGFAAVGISFDAVEWDKIGEIAASWVVSPMLAGGMSFALFWSVKLLILDTAKPLQRAMKYIPVYMFAVGFMIGMVTLLKGLKHVIKDRSVSLELLEVAGIAIFFGLAATIIGIALLKASVARKKSKSATEDKVERVFAVLMVFTACSMAFAHGSNDVANAIGPVAAVFSVVQSGTVAVRSEVPGWVLLVGATGIVVGLASFGYKVMGTVGRRITELTPSRGFAAELGAASTVVVASLCGLPISTTHTLVGAVIGVGLANSAEKVDFRVLGTIAMSWVVTIPVGAILSVVLFYLFRAIFG